MTRKTAAEFLGTFILVFFGCGVNHAATLFGAQVGLWQIAVVWGFAVMFGIYVSAAISGGHLNPAMTLAFAVHRKMPISEVVPYWVGQFAGAFCAAALLFIVFQPSITAFEKSKDIERGSFESVVTARCYGEYYSSPDKVNEADWEQQQRWVPMTSAFLAEMIGTALLALIVFSLIDHRNGSRPAAHHTPFFIGLTIAILISLFAPLTQAGFNPARDFGPRLFAFVAGWQDAAIPGPNGHGFWIVYILAPCVGSVLGGLLYDSVIRPGLKEESVKAE